MKKNNEPTCLVFIVSIIALFILYQVIKFIRQPDALLQLIEFFTAVGICLGVFILFLIVIFIYQSISDRVKGRFIRQSQDYPALCFVKRMAKFDGYGPIPDDLPEESPWDPCYPISVSVVMSNHGLWIREKIDKSLNEFEAANIFEQHEYFRRNLDNSIIPLSHLKLFYIPYRNEGNVKLMVSPAFR